MTRTLAILTVAAVAMSNPERVESQTPPWPIHSMERPTPLVVDPGPFTASVPPPSDAIVLFGGKSLEKWRSSDDPNRPARWKVRQGYFEVVAGTGGIGTMEGFGDVQLHVEWMSPNPPRGKVRIAGTAASS